MKKFTAKQKKRITKQVERTLALRRRPIPKEVKKLNDMNRRLGAPGKWEDN